MGKALCFHSKDCKQPKSCLKQCSCILSVLSSIYIQHLPTFVPDQHALQRSTSCDLTQPQFPVHLLLCVGWQKASVSTKTQFPFLHCDSKLFLKKTSNCVSDNRDWGAQASSPSHRLHCGVRRLYIQQSESERETQRHLQPNYLPM